MSPFSYYYGWRWLICLSLSWLFVRRFINFSPCATHSQQTILRRDTRRDIQTTQTIPASLPLQLQRIPMLFVINHIAGMHSLLQQQPLLKNVLFCAGDYANAKPLTARFISTFFCCLCSMLRWCDDGGAKHSERILSQHLQRVATDVKRG